MVNATLRQRFLGAIVVGIMCLDAAAANDSPTSALALEQQAHAEFAQAGDAVRERLTREAAGDLIGARIAAGDADNHRYRFLDIQRELGRLHSRTARPPSVAASRSPFVPDPSFSAPPSAEGSAPKPERKEPQPVRPSHPAWDMYRPHELPESSGVPDGAQLKQESKAPGAPGGAGDMYSNGLAWRVSDKEVAAADPSGSVPSGEPPREPFLVYRARDADSEVRE
jgi:hypothetical protein